MRRTIRHNVTIDVPVTEKFLMVYLEIGEGFDKPTVSAFRKLIWHLEDENRPANALCGMPLHSAAKSASPALAMLARPCKECAAVVVKYLQPVKGETLLNRIKGMLVQDVPFRRNVSRVVPAEMFVANLPLTTRQPSKTKNGKG